MEQQHPGSVVAAGHVLCIIRSRQDNAPQGIIAWVGQESPPASAVLSRLTTVVGVSSEARKG